MAGPQPSVTAPRLLAVSLVALVLVAASGAYLTGVFAGTPCHDSPAAIDVAPREFSFETDGSGVLITFEAGKPFTEAETSELVVAVSGADGNATETVVWAVDHAGQLPVTPGTTFRVENASVNAVALRSGTTLAVQWRGHEWPLPPYCLNEREFEHGVWTRTYAEYVVP